MKFTLIDSVVSQAPDRIVAIKQVSLAEEYLADHFPGFPVLPGVMMVEAMVQAARRMLAGRGQPRLVLGQMRAVKFGAMVRPGQILEIEVTLDKDPGDGTFACRGVGRVRAANSAEDSPGAGETAVSGRFIMRPIQAEGPNRTGATHAGDGGHEPR